MYKFFIQNDLDTFDAFSKSAGGSILQSSGWAKVKYTWKPYFYMGYDENNSAVLACLCLERKIPLFGKLWYAPNGFVCDTANQELVSEFARFIRKEMKTHGAFAMCTDPLFPTAIDKTAVPDDGSAQAFEKAGFTAVFDRENYLVQPPTDIIVSLTDSGNNPVKEEVLLKKCQKGVRHGLNVAQFGCLKTETYNGSEAGINSQIIDNFFDIITETLDRLEVISREKEYYLSVMKNLGDNVSIDFVYFDADEAAAKAKEARALIKTDDCSPAEGTGKTMQSPQERKQTEEAQHFLSLYDKILSEYGKKPEGRIYLACGVTARFGKTAICLYGGTKNLFRNILRPTHLLNWSRIKASLAAGCTVHCMGRIPGNPYDSNNPYYGLGQYKCSYAGSIYTYSGEWFLTAGRLRMKLFYGMMPRIRHIKTLLHRFFGK